MGIFRAKNERTKRKPTCCILPGKFQPDFEMGCMCSALMQVQNTDVLSTLTDSFFFTDSKLNLEIKFRGNCFVFSAPIF